MTQARTTVLILERHAPSRAALALLLADAGFDVVGDPAQAGIDVALVDVGYPIVDGEEVAKRLFATSPGIQIVYLAYERWTPSQIEGVVLEKPIAIEALIELLLRTRR